MTKRNKNNENKNSEQSRSKKKKKIERLKSGTKKKKYYIEQKILYTVTKSVIVLSGCYHFHRHHQRD